MMSEWMSFDLEGAGAGEPVFDYDPMSPEFRRDPYSAYRALRSVRPVFWVEQLGIWVLTRYADIVPLLRDRRLGMIPTGLREVFLGPGPAFTLSEKILGLIDPPDHTRLRGLVGRAFSARAVEALRPRVQAVVDTLIDAVEGLEAFDLMEALALPLPVRVISGMLGVPEEDGPRFKAWTEALLLLFDSPLMYTDARVARCNEAAGEIVEYLERLIARKRLQPGDDLISGLIEAEEAGDRLSPFEVVQISANLMLGGYETTMGLIGNGVLALLQNPEQFTALKKDPELARGAVEEILRYDSPFIATVRRATEALEVGGRQVGAGQIMCLLLAAANRDPEQFEEPDRFDIRREGPNIAFGGGVHACLGAALARLEGEVVFGTLARRMPGLRLLEQELEWRDSQITRILLRLRVGNEA